MSQYFGELLAIFAALCGAASSIMYNRLGSRAGSDLIAYLRMAIAAPLMCTYALIVDGGAIFSCNLNQILGLFISGVIGFFITDLFMFRAYVIWGARETMVVMCLSPVLSGIAAYFLFNEALTVKQIVGSLLSVTGVIIMTLGGGKRKGAVATAGIIYAVLAAIFQSLSDMTSKASLVDMPWVSSSAIRAIGGLFAWVIFGFCMRKIFFDRINEVKHPKVFFLLCLAVLTGTALGTSAAMGALEKAPAGVVTSLKQVSPVFILPYEALVLKRKFKWSDIVGTLISVFGVFLLF